MSTSSRSSRLFALVLAVFVALLVGCGGGTGGSSTSGGSTGVTTGGGSGTIASHMSYISGVPVQDYAASTAPQTVRLLVGSSTVTLNNAIVTSVIFSTNTYTFLNVGSKPINGTRSGSTMSTIIGNISYDVPLGADGATTRPILTGFSTTTIYPLSSLGRLKFPNGINVLLVSRDTLPGAHTADLTGTYKVDAPLGYLSGTGTLTFTFTGGGIGEGGVLFAGPSSASLSLGNTDLRTSPVTETFSGVLPPTGDAAFTDARITFNLP